MEKAKKRKEIKKAFLQRITKYDSFNKLLNDLRKEYFYNFSLEEIEDYKTIWNAFKRHQEHEKRLYKAMFQQFGYALLTVIISIFTLAAVAMV